MTMYLFNEEPFCKPILSWMVDLWACWRLLCSYFFPQKRVFITAILCATVLLLLKRFCLFVCFCHWLCKYQPFISKINALLAKVESPRQSLPIGLIVSTVQSEFHGSKESWVSFPTCSNWSVRVGQRLGFFEAFRWCCCISVLQRDCTQWIKW